MQKGLKATADGGLWHDPDWVEMHGYDTGMSFGNELRYGGKWVAYGTEDEIRHMAARAEEELGRTLEAMKYSTIPARLNNRSPPGAFALVMYCNQWTRQPARKALEARGFEQLEWISNIYSIPRYLKDQRFVWTMSMIDPDTLLEMGDIAGIDMSGYVDGRDRLMDELDAALVSTARKLAEENGEMQPFEKAMAEMEKERSAELDRRVKRRRR